MTATTVTSPVTSRARLLRSEWTKVSSVRSTIWSLAILVVAAIGLNTLIVGLTIGHWDTLSASTRQNILGDPTGFLAAALGVAQIPLCVLAVLVITSEYATGMIRASLLAVPRRVPMLAAKAAVTAGLAFGAGQVVAFASFLIARPIIGNHLPESLGDPATLRAVLGVGLYLTVLALFAFAVGAIIRHTAAAITAVTGLVLVARTLGGLLPGSAGQHVNAYLPANAGLLITHARQQSDDLLAPWAGFGVFCLWTAALLVVAGLLLMRRDA